MSNIGKTHLSKKLCEVGFTHINCDDLIELKLEKKLKAVGYSGIKEVARWMGQPFDERYFKNQKEYLSFENDVMKNIFKQKKNKNTIIDTTGSVVHTGIQMCTNLKFFSLVIYIEATEKMKERMFKQYIKEPKPVVFGNMFNQKRNETNSESLKRCYRDLLDARSALYKKYADVIIPRDTIKINISANKFIALIKNSL